MRSTTAILFVLLAPCSVALAENWPHWRGPHHNGFTAEAAPLTWSRTDNVRWRVALPGPGNSTPIIWGDHVFLTQALDGGKRRALIAFHRADGKQLWQHEVPCPVVETTHKQNPPCSASPVTDGNAVYAHFASAGVVACDFQGKELWRRDFGPVLHRWGNGGSPILYKDLLIVTQGPGEPTFLIALDKRTGQTVWKRDEISINSPVFGSWSTPLVLKTSGRDELIMPFATALPNSQIGDRKVSPFGEGVLKAFDPATGAPLWTCAGLGSEIYAMPNVPTAAATPAPNARAEASAVIVGISGHNGPLVAVKSGGQGDVTQSHRLWLQSGKNPQRIGNGILHQGRLFLPNAAGGTVECLDVKSGDVIWKERVGDNLWGSMVLAKDRLYVSGFEGTTYVLAAGPKFSLLARNELKEDLYAAPAVANGELFLRTYQHLYCIRP